MREMIERVRTEAIEMMRNLDLEGVVNEVGFIGFLGCVIVNGEMFGWL